MPLESPKSLPILHWPKRPQPAASVPSCLRAFVPFSCQNRLYHGDNLPLLQKLLPELAGKLDLIYIDPPFNTGMRFALQGQLEGEAYCDQHEDGIAGYLSMMFPRLQLMHQLLSPHGTMYVHCDWRICSHLRLLLDEIFGCENLRSQIVWHYQSGGRQKHCWSNKHDTIWMYSRSSRFTFNMEAVAVRRGPIPRNHMKRHTDENGKVVYSIRSNGKVYSYSEDDLITPSDVWTDISHLQQKDPERTGYATQKPEKLLERIILASSNEGDLVADFFCGSGTLPAVAQRLNRRWIASDASASAIEISSRRLNIPVCSASRE